MNLEGFWWIPPHGGTKADGETTLERTGRWTGIPPAGGHNVRGGIVGGGYLRLYPPDHSHIVHCDRPIMYLCMVAARRPGSRVANL